MHMCPRCGGTINPNTNVCDRCQSNNNIPEDINNINPVLNNVANMQNNNANEIDPSKVTLREQMAKIDTMSDVKPKKKMTFSKALVLIIVSLAALLVIYMLIVGLGSLGVNKTLSKAKISSYETMGNNLSLGLEQYYKMCLIRSGKDANGNICTYDFSKLSAEEIKAKTEVKGTIPDGSKGEYDFFVMDIENDVAVISYHIDGLICSNAEKENNKYYLHDGNKKVVCRLDKKKDDLNKDGNKENDNKVSVSHPNEEETKTDDTINKTLTVDEFKSISNSLFSALDLYYSMCMIRDGKTSGGNDCIYDFTSLSANDIIKHLELSIEKEKMKSISNYIVSLKFDMEEYETIFNLTMDGIKCSNTETINGQLVIFEDYYCYGNGVTIEQAYKEKNSMSPSIAVSMYESTGNQLALALETYHQICNLRNGKNLNDNPCTYDFTHSPSRFIKNELEVKGKIPEGIFGEYHIFKYDENLDITLIEFEKNGVICGNVTKSGTNYVLKSDGSVTCQIK